MDNMLKVATAPTSLRVKHVIGNCAPRKIELRLYIFVVHATSPVHCNPFVFNTKDQYKYFLWQERNLRYFQGMSRSFDGVCQLIRENVRLRVLSLKIRRSKRSLEAAGIWKFRVLQRELYENG